MNVDPQYVLKFLPDTSYPASKDELVEKATSEGGDAYVRAAVKALPEQEFASREDVVRVLESVELPDAPEGADADADARPTGS